MGKWKKLIAIGLAVSMIMPSCIPQTLWAAEFSADDSVSVKEEFADGTEEEQLSENIRMQEFETGETDADNDMSFLSPDTDNSEQSEQKEADTDQVAEGITMQLYSEGKLEKVYVIPYADIDAATAPAALNGKSGYIFKEWNTKDDGTGDVYKPGDSLKNLLISVNPEVQNQEETAKITENTVDSEQSIENSVNVDAEKVRNSQQTVDSEEGVSAETAEATEVAVDIEQTKSTEELSGTSSAKHFTADTMIITISRLHTL